MFRASDEEFVRCAIQHSIDYRKNVVIIDFPRTCLSSPRWVRICAAVNMWEPDGRGAHYNFEDNALKGFVANSTDPPLSPRITRR